ncbi:hypothetical protein M569_12212 [Genlisea aurea]|uniref:Uncharacterized protein n=1 Tax=Genlisea aurea TaxID=192259 RepID=S8DIF6_9LAMI|nr:hypothetical protein M569_12212 [Genlisea aurea]
MDLRGGGTGKVAGRETLAFFFSTSNADAKKSRRLHRRKEEFISIASRVTRFLILRRKTCSLALISLAVVGVFAIVIDCCWVAVENNQFWVIRSFLGVRYFVLGFFEISGGLNLDISSGVAAIVELWSIFRVLRPMRTHFPLDYSKEQQHKSNSINPQPWLQVERGKLANLDAHSPSSV